MLSEQAIRVLSSQQFNPDSDWGVNFLPFGSIYWKDEWPETLLAELFEQVDDLSIIHAMFGMRLKIWNGEALSVQDRALWDAVKFQVPKWALFKRLVLTDEQRCAREEAERLVEKELSSFGADPVSASTKPPFRTTALAVAGYCLAAVALAFIVLCAGVWLVAPVDWRTRWMVTAACAAACSVSIWLSRRCLAIRDRT